MKRKPLKVEFVNHEELPGVAKELTVLLCQLYLKKNINRLIKNF